MKIKRLHQDGGIDLHVAIVLVLVLVVGAFAYMRVANDDTEVQNNESQSAIQGDVEAIDSHLDTEDVAEVVAPEVSQEDTQETIDELRSYKDGADTYGPDDENADSDPSGEEPAQHSSEARALGWQEFSAAADSTDTCGAKGGPGQVTFYASDYKQFPSAYFGDVELAKGGGYHCGILSLTTSGFFDTEFNGPEYDIASLLLRLDEGSLDQMFDFADGDELSVCAEVRVMTDNVGFRIISDDGSSPSAFLKSTPDDGFVNHCVDVKYVEDSGDQDNGNIYFHTSLLDSSGKAFQGVQLQRVTVTAIE